MSNEGKPSETALLVGGAQRKGRKLSTRGRWYRMLSLACVVAVASLVPASLVAANVSSAATGKVASGAKITVAFSQIYCGNTWRATEDKAFYTEIAAFEKLGVVSGVRYLCANDNVATQESQIGDLILDHPSVLLIDPGSATALNGVIGQAKAAHIPVLVFDSGPVTSTYPYELDGDIPALMTVLGQYIVQRLHGAGNVLEVRGLPGVADELVFHQTLLKVFKPYPKIHLVSSVWGKWTDSVTETQVASVLSGLPPIAAVASQGGSYGAVEAFEAAGRPIPLVVGDDRGTFIKWWIAENKKNGYSTLSSETDPGIAAGAVYMGVQIALGKKVPRVTNMPILTITQSTLAEYANVPVSDVAVSHYSMTWFQKNLMG